MEISHSSSSSNRSQPSPKQNRFSIHTCQKATVVIQEKLKESSSGSSSPIGKRKSLEHSISDFSSATLALKRSQFANQLGPRSEKNLQTWIGLQDMPESPKDPPKKQIFISSVISFFKHIGDSSKIEKLIAARLLKQLFCANEFPSLFLLYDDFHKAKQKVEEIFKSEWAEVLFITSRFEETEKKEIKTASLKKKISTWQEEIKKREISFEGFIFALHQLTPKEKVELQEIYGESWLKWLDNKKHIETLLKHVVEKVTSLHSILIKAHKPIFFNEVFYCSDPEQVLLSFRNYENEKDSSFFRVVKENKEQSFIDLKNSEFIEWFRKTKEGRKITAEQAFAVWLLGEIDHYTWKKGTSENEYFEFLHAWMHPFDTKTEGDIKKIFVEWLDHCEEKANENPQILADPSKFYKDILQDLKQRILKVSDLDKDVFRVFKEAFDQENSYLFSSIAPVKDDRLHYKRSSLKINLDINDLFLRLERLVTNLKHSSKHPYLSLLRAVAQANFSKAVDFVNETLSGTSESQKKYQWKPKKETYTQYTVTIDPLKEGFTVVYRKVFGLEKPSKEPKKIAEAEVFLTIKGKLGKLEFEGECHFGNLLLTSDGSFAELEEAFEYIKHYLNSKHH